MSLSEQVPMAVVPACLGHLAGTGARAGIAHADCCNGGGGGAGIVCLVATGPSNFAMDAL